MRTVYVTLIIEQVEDDTDVPKFVQGVERCIQDHVLPYHTVSLVELEVR